MSLDEPSPKVNPKKRKRSVVLPRTMIIDAKSATWRFVQQPHGLCELAWLRKCLGTEQDIECVPLVDALSNHGYHLYADGLGMIKSLPMNLAANPFIPPETLCYLASFGGPYGNLVLHRTGTGHIQAQPLKALCQKADDRDETDGAYADMLEQALQAFENPDDDASESTSGS